MAIYPRPKESFSLLPHFHSTYKANHPPPLCAPIHPSTRPLARLSPRRLRAPLQQAGRRARVLLRLLCSQAAPGSEAAQLTLDTPAPLQENNRRLVAVQRLDEVKAVYIDLDVSGLQDNLSAFAGELRALRGSSS